MKTTALRLHGKKDLRLEQFELPEMKDDEILASVVTNSICMSDYKMVIQGEEHKRVTKDIAEKPIIVGHEQCGTILKVGEKLKDKYKAGTKYGIQPAINYPGRESEAVGYSYQFVGGDATKVVIPSEVIRMNCLIPYSGDSYFKASLSEPVACILGALKLQYHTRPQRYEHEMGIKNNGKLALLGGAGPMGLEFLDILVHAERKPRLIVLTDINQDKLERAARLFPPDEVARLGVRVFYLNVENENAVKELMSISDNNGYDDVLVMVPSAAVVEQASHILGSDGCVNFFTGPADPNFNAPFNFYNVHYHGHHVIGSVGSTTDDMLDALDLIGRGIINPAIMITHVGGLDSAANSILNLPNIPGGKKLIYTGISLPLIALDDFETLGESDPLWKDLSLITKGNKGIWSKEAEDFLLAHARPINN